MNTELDRLKQRAGHPEPGASDGSFYGLLMFFAFAYLVLESLMITETLALEMLGDISLLALSVGMLILILAILKTPGMLFGFMLIWVALDSWYVLTLFVSLPAEDVDRVFDMIDRWLYPEAFTLLHPILVFCTAALVGLARRAGTKS